MLDLAEIISRLPPDLAAELRDALAARIDRRKPPFAARLDRRDEAIRALASSFYADAKSRTEAARRIERDLGLWRPGPAGLQPTGRAAALAGALSLCDGKPPGRYQIENVLAGKRR